MRLNKKCSLCKETKLLSEYWKHKDAKDGLYAHCKTCHTLQSKKTREKYREKYRERARILSAEWRKRNPELNKQRNKKYRELYKDKYLLNRRIKRLEERKLVIKNYYPKNLQILCHNCNMAKGFYGECPHYNYKIRRVVD